MHQLLVVWTPLRPAPTAPEHRLGFGPWEGETPPELGGRYVRMRSGVRYDVGCSAAACPAAPDLAWPAARCDACVPAATEPPPRRAPPAPTTAGAVGTDGPGV